MIKKCVSVIHFFQTCILLSIAACGTDDTYVEQSGKFRCGDHGFCLTMNTPTQFYGAFRDNDRELQFEVAFYHHDMAGVLHGSSKYCARLLTDHGHVISQIGPPCRPEWLEQPNGDILHHDVELCSYF